ncbi:MAG: diphosphomevalonate decarboxylase [Saprospiraceae bacterium]|jgi:diphosphomevalonate decarboxylase
MLDYANPKLVINSATTEPGTIAWRSPSNLAIIKYWGKYGKQLPRNPSISITLDAAFTETTMAFAAKTGADEGISLNFLFENKPNEAFRGKLLKFLESITDIFPFIKQLHLTIRSYNSFPHSAGIASSASSMSALALCLCSLEHQLFGTLEKDEDFRKKASYISRLGSGSACRSVYAKMALWGELGTVEGSSDLFAIPYEDKTHAIFKNCHDDILIASRGEKSVSSSAGHGLMEDNIYADNRYTQARQRLYNLVDILRAGDFDAFGRIAENEALTLHALMMMSNPSYILMHPNSLAMIEKVRQFRQDTSTPLYFSLDAGPNLHLLYPDEVTLPVKEFINSELLPLCENGEMIADKAGEGPLEV